MSNVSQSDTDVLVAGLCSRVIMTKTTSAVQEMPADPAGFPCLHPPRIRPIVTMRKPLVTEKNRNHHKQNNGIAIGCCHKHTALRYTHISSAKECDAARRQ
jgi:hypothetical protein